MTDKGKISILYVDDEEINLLLFRMTLMDHFRIITADSPVTAIEIFRNDNINLVITDYKMPLMNGMELIRQIKSINPNIGCIILSGYLESDVIIDKELLYSYIMKPWDKGQIIRTIKDAVGD
jgi:YesN/AraC family two-component response regulator